MRISHSVWRKFVVMLVAVLGFLLLYQATIRDSRYAARQAELQESEADPAVGTRLRFNASAYCTGDVTASGLPPRSGIAAADPELLPTGSVVQVSGLGPRYDGVYTIMDTGGIVRGRMIDLYMRNCDEAVRFGRHDVELFVLRLGWNPRASGPSLLDTLLPWRDDAPPAKPPATPPATPKSPAPAQK